MQFSPDGRRLLAHPPCATPLTCIGEITLDRRRLLHQRDGQFLPLPALGWKHGFDGGC